MGRRPVPKALKGSHKQTQSGPRRVLLVDGPCASPESFVRGDAHPGVALRIAVPRGFDMASYVEDRLVDGVWHYRWEHE